MSNSSSIIDNSACTAPPTDDTAPDWLVNGGFMPVILGTIVMFWGITFICEEYGVPSLRKFCERNHYSDDFTGSFVIGTGLSLPVFFISLVGLFASNSAIGVGAVVGGNVFNHLVTIPCSIYVSPHRIMRLDPVTFTREMLCYFLSCLLLIWATQDGKVGRGFQRLYDLDQWQSCLSIPWLSSFVLVLAYCFYILLTAYYSTVVDRIKYFFQAYLVVFTGDTGSVSSDEDIERGPHRTTSPPRRFSSSSFSKPTATVFVQPYSPPEGLILRRRSPSGSRPLEEEREEVQTEREVRDSSSSLHPGVQVEDVEIASRSSNSNTSNSNSSSSPHMPHEIRVMQKAEQRKSLEAQQQQQDLLQQLQSPQTDEEVIEEESSLRQQYYDFEPLSTSLDDTTNLHEAGGGDYHARPFSLTSSSSHHKHLRLPLSNRDHDDESSSDDLNNIVQPVNNMFAYPSNILEQIFYWLVFPMKLAIYLTVPDVRLPRHESRALVAFTLTLIWLGIQSYLLTVSLTLLGTWWNVNGAVMGLTVAAWAGNYPAHWSSLIVARKGDGDIASCNVYGSNVFNNCIGLGLPWILYSLTSDGYQDYNALQDQGVVLSLVLLMGAIVIHYLFAAVCGFVHTFWMIPVMFAMYLGILIYLCYFLISLPS